jgi:hypothetical protein
LDQALPDKAAHKLFTRADRVVVQKQKIQGDSIFPFINQALEGPLALKNMITEPS